MAIDMNKSHKLLVACTTGLIGAQLIAGEASAGPTEAERVLQSRELIKSFAKRLKDELVGAIKSGGPVSAIPVCRTAAPEIARTKAAEKGWSLGRTALKLRNPANTPDAWERAVLEKFAKEARQGADLAKLEHYETTTHNGKRVFRYMKAIPTQKPCLTCHGADVTVDLKEKIRAFYPQDQATGFALGELRGAFTIIQPVK